MMNLRCNELLDGFTRALHELLDGFTRALHDKNAAGVIVPLSDKVIAFDLAPPLRLGPEELHDAARLEEWFSTWKGPILSESYDRTIVVDGDVAYAFGLQRMTGTKTDGEEVELWFRATACFRRENSSWRITHMHNSVPFAMATSSAALALGPQARPVSSSALAKAPNGPILDSRSKS
jgi:ketosteroid isomerase-like protein